METITLRDYQQECVNIINNTESGSYLVAVATGLGKTVIFSHIKRRGRMLILSHREELVWQPRKYFDCTFGVEQADNHSNGEEVVSASVQSLVRRLDSFSPDDFDIIITDEAHHAVADTYRRIYDYFKPRLHIGFTATPNRADNVKLGEIYSKILYERNLKWGIDHKYLTDVKCFTVDIGFDLSEVHKQCDDLNLAELSSAVDNPLQNQKVAAAYYEKAVGQTLIFATTVQHAYHIAELIDGAVVVTAETQNRAEIIERFTNREIPCLVNCMVFTEGTDMPLIETVIIARPTRNASLYTQMVGRGLRTHEGKDALNLIDCVGITGKLDICQAPDLFGIGEIPKDIPPEKLQGKLLTEIEEMVTEELNKPVPPPDWKINVQLIKLFADNGNYDTHNVNYVVLPNGDMTCSIGEGRIFRVTAEDITGNSSAYLKHDDIIVRTVPTAPMQDILDEVHHILVCDYQQAIYLWDIPHVMRWANVPASDKQKALIQRLARKKKRKDIQVNDLSKYEASVLIGQMTG